MNLTPHSLTKLFILSAISVCVLAACSVAKIEARIEANPQCKDVINPKTGAVMPCPGTDKAFYRSVGLESAKVVLPVAAVSAAAPVTTDTATAAGPSVNTVKPSATVVAPQAHCKPQIHKKTGGILPCPAAD
ncbi:hypothetical protein FD961_04420 [Polynucleobacter sp. TSB-Sco08W16]|uniref:hypothetical protein n=1 Tax=Polynucleobacter sp. TSB-Sco08W16 TaxID=1758374 RepID=UPI001BFE26E1|nr:hypothetical protein [Polynucleobacter sp. TSB-Sco08W16]QWD75055.1 hypothetical protein FD961_04420 [Polynucleobacter sp. TSB-Sco08W16]